MNRLFSCIRRRPHIVDLMIQTQAVDSYRLKWAQNFDGSFTTIITASNVGFYDDNIPRGAVESQPSTGTSVRVTFDPTTFSITDTSSFWLQFVPVTGGVEGTPSAPTLVLPDSAHHGVGEVIIAGNAPLGATSANSLQLDLPRLMHDFRIRNEDPANNLYVSTEQGGPEIFVRPDTFPQLQMLMGTQGSLWVRATGGAVPFAAVFTLAFPR